MLSHRWLACVSLQAAPVGGFRYVKRVFFWYDQLITFFFPGLLVGLVSTLKILRVFISRSLEVSKFPEGIDFVGRGSGGLAFASTVAGAKGKVSYDGDRTASKHGRSDGHQSGWCGK